ncbi:MAG TPA: patatin-like phospholipase family protein, partial [Eubacteriales bacterium]|nr:patatin-like phospholipase family protein [Eubacteriales bacterium]
MKLGLVLEGGGVKGAYHIGALKALLEAGYRFDGVAGTSIGALNAAMIAQGEFDKLVQIWNCVEASDILDVDTEMFERLAGGAKLDKPTLFYFVRLLRSFPEVYKNSTEKMRAFVRENLNEDKIRRSPMDFGLVTVSLPDF